MLKWIHRQELRCSLGSQWLRWKEVKRAVILSFFCSLLSFHGGAPHTPTQTNPTIMLPWINNVLSHNFVHSDDVVSVTAKQNPPSQSWRSWCVPDDSNYSPFRLSGGRGRLLDFPQITSQNAVESVWVGVRRQQDRSRSYLKKTAIRVDFKSVHLYKDESLLCIQAQCHRSSTQSMSFTRFRQILYYWGHCVFVY